MVEGKCRIENIPDIGDVKVLTDVLIHMGAKVSYIDRNTIEIDSSQINTYKATYEMVKSLRGSYYIIGALLGRFGQAEVPFPGGCNFGYRPIDQHIKGFEALGAKVEMEYGISRQKQVNFQELLFTWM